MSRYVKEVNKHLINIKDGDGSQDSLKDLFNLTSNHLKVVARGYLRDKSYAEDVVIETFQKAYRYIDSFDEHQDGYNWLCKTTQRISYNYNNKYDSAVESEMRKVRREDLETFDMNIDLSYALERLEPESKQIIIMYYFLGYTLDEIGKRLNRDKASISRRIKKILKQLKDYLTS